MRSATGAGRVTRSAISAARTTAWATRARPSSSTSQQLVIVREIGDRRGEGNALGNLGSAHANLGDTRKAVEFQEQALVIDREIGDRRGEGTDSFNLALKLWRLGERARALQLMETAWKIFTAIESPNAERAGELLQKWRGEMGGGA